MEKTSPNKVLLEEVYKPPKNIQEFVFDVYEKYIKWRALRERPYKQFNNKTLTSYLTEAREKFWGYLPLTNDDTKQFFFPETRNQIVNILARIANLRLKPSFEGVEGMDIVKSTLLSDLFEYWRRKTNRKLNNFWQYLYNVINGTVVVFVAYNSNIKKVKNITLYDPSKGKTQYEEDEKDESDVEEVIVNLEDLYIPKIWEPDIQKQDEIIWRTLMKFSDFKNAFEGYSESEYVIPGQQFADKSIFADFISYDVRGGDFVEVIRYFNATKDQYAIIANGVLLNPIKYKTKREISPLPWNHKKLPFAKTILEPIDSSFFYGMPLAQKVKSPQDALNKLWSLLIDREERAIAAPILTNDASVETGLEYRAGRFYVVQGDPNTNYRELQISPASGSFWNALTTLQGIIQKTGTGGIGPILPTRQPRTATEKSLESQQQKEIAGLYNLFYQDLLEQKVWIVLNNIIQFYTSQKVKKIIGNKKYNKIIYLTNTNLIGGGIGNREIRIIDEISEPEKLQEESYIRSLLKKEKVEIIEVTPKALQQLEFDIKINFEMENSPETERALYLDFIVTIWKLFGQFGLLSPKKSLFRVMEKFNENIYDFIDENLAAEYEKERFDVMGGIPEQVNNYNQSLRGQIYGAEARTMDNEPQTILGQYGNV
jgi:hypothetical protein